MEWEDKNLVGDESTGGIFPGGGKEQIFSWWEGSPLILPSRKTNIYIYNIVLACVQILLINHNPSISLSPEVLKNVISRPRHAKSPDNSNVFLMFSNNTYISEQPTNTS